MLNHTFRLLLPSFALLFSSVVSANELSNVQENIRLLDKKISLLAGQFYKSLATNSDTQTKPLKTIRELDDLLSSPQGQTPNYSILAIIHANLNFTNLNLNPTTTPRVLKHLLVGNDLKTAMLLFQTIEQSGDNLLIAKASIRLAEYYNSRKLWKKTLSILDIDLEELSEFDASQASMARGLALQNLKKHRQSIKEYKKVLSGTPFYKSAQTNIAVAHLRQDWWTDAHLIIKQLLTPDSNITTEFRDRLNLMLGYSFFNEEYFRESREAFRSISLESIYTNRAIMGLVLAAIAQQDYSSALNTLTILNQKPGNELVVEETYLLLPHLHQKLQQFSKATSAYQRGINYYEQRISQLDLIIPAIIANNFDSVANHQTSSIQLANTKFELSELYPEYFQKNLILLNHMKNHSASSKIETELEELMKEYRSAFEDVSKSLVERRVNALSSYLSQSKYGLAQLYDSSDE